ncbi:MAG: hypothetical protein ACRDYC_08315 [Acidimicrobiales bacterium]
MRRSAATTRRDAGLARLRSATSWVTVGSIAALGALSAFVAESLPGRANATPYPGGGTATTTTVPATPPDSGYTDPQSTVPSTAVPSLQPPQTTPVPINYVPVPTHRHVVSGGS